ncbi:MAG: S8 family peptidase [Mobilitalea sp.]
MNGACGNHIVSEEYVDFIADYELSSAEDLISNEICYIPVDSTYTAVYMPQQLVPLRPWEEYGYKVIIRLFGLLDLKSLEDSGVQRLRNIPGIELRGQQVLIGIVDTGIDYTHKAFINADGTTKIESIWDQSIQSENPPEGLYFGTEYTREQINAALSSSNPLSIVPSTDEIGHGTFLAGIAAGNADIENDFSGVVPDSDLVVVKLKPAKKRIKDFYMIADDINCYQENDIMLGVKYLVDTAAKYNRPISICIGLGTSQGAHDEYGTLTSYLSSLTQLDGVAITIAAGNEGNSRHHFETLMPVGIDTETIELIVGANEPGLYLEIWGDVPNTFSIEMITAWGENVPLITPRINERREINFIFETTILNIDFQLVGSRSGAQLVVMRFQNPASGTWRIIINKVNKSLDLHINSWLPINGFISNDTFFVRSSPYTTLTSPGNAFNPVVATAYDSQNGSLYLYASRGFTRTGQISPDLAAPGVNIIGPIQGNSYAPASGTSIAAAHTAGIAAMLLEWGKVKRNVRYMDGIDVKNLLIRGADREPNKIYPNREDGYGTLDIYGVFDSLRGNI